MNRHSLLLHGHWVLSLLSMKYEEEKFTSLRMVTFHKCICAKWSSHTGLIYPLPLSRIQVYTTTLTPESNSFAKKPQSCTTMRGALDHNVGKWTHSSQLHLVCFLRFIHMDTSNVLRSLPIDHTRRFPAQCFNSVAAAGIPNELCISHMSLHFYQDS